MYENRNLYLYARLDTCADINIMPASVYKLVFRDPNLEKLTPNRLKIGTYTNNTVKIVGTCKLYLIHLDTKKLIETIFCVATNDGSVLLSCTSTLALDLIPPRSRLDYLPPGKSYNKHTRSPQENQTCANTSTNIQFKTAACTKPLSSRSNYAISCARFTASARNKTAKVSQEDHKQGPYYETLPRCF